MAALLDWVKNRLPDSRQIINATIVTLSLIVVALALGQAWEGWREYRAARQLENAHATASRFMEAATWRALERTYTNVALAAPDTPSRKILDSLAGARRNGDRIWQNAMAMANELADDRPEYARLSGKLLAANSAFGNLAVARAKVDACFAGALCPIDLPSWQLVINELLHSSALVRESVFIPQDASNATRLIHLTLRRRAWAINEYVRQTRGLMAFYLTSGEAPPHDIHDQINQARGVVDDALEILVNVRQAHAIDRSVSVAIDRASQAVNGLYWPLLEAIMHHQASMDAAAWLARSEPTLVALETLNTTINQAIRDQAAADAREIRYNMLWRGLLGMLAILLALLSLTRVRVIANALFHQKELAEVTIRSIGDAVITTDAQNRVQYLNPVAERMTGWPSAEARGLPLADVFNIVDGINLQPQPSPMEACLRENRVVGLDNNTVLLRRDGGRHYIEDSAAPIRDMTGQLVGGVLVFYDTAESHQAGHLISYHATHDSLTGLINRREFEHKLAELLVRSSKTSPSYPNAVLCLDMDQFKVINDTCGHRAGDQLLRMVSQTLRGQVRETDSLARLGGDEFGLLMEHCDLERALHIAEALRVAVSKLIFQWEDSAFELRVSIGLVPFQGSDTSPAVLLGQADAACHVAKDKGRDRVQVYEHGDLDMTKRHSEMRWVPRITKALADDRFQLFCQPIRAIAPDGGDHGEVLIRMLDEHGALIPPGDFIPPAERYGLMPAIDHWVIHNALLVFGECCARLGAARCGSLAINLSGTTLSDPGIEHFLREEIAIAHVPPSHITFEVTESAAVGNLAETAQLIRSLKEIGCRFSLDDFGSGMSSFMYLKQLPVDYLKIDGSFVRSIEADPVSRAMVQAIHTVGRAMGIKTIAEYVENPAIERHLRHIGVDYAQGYAIGRPVPLRDYIDACNTSQAADASKG